MYFCGSPTSESAKDSFKVAFVHPKSTPAAASASSIRYQGLALADFAGWERRLPALSSLPTRSSLLAAMAAKDKSHYLAGQTKELDLKAPDAEALQIFYTSLLEEKPDSEMALKWMLQHGLHDSETAKKLAAKFGARTKSQGNNKKAPTKKARDDDFSEKKPPVKKKAAPTKKIDPDSSDEEFIQKAPVKKKVATEPMVKAEKNGLPPPSKPESKRPLPPPKPKLPIPMVDSSDEEDVPLSQRR